MPVEGHPPAAQGTGAGLATLALKVEKSFSTRLEPQAAQETVVSAWATSISKVAPHFLQLYSKIGMGFLVCVRRV